MTAWILYLAGGAFFGARAGMALARGKVPAGVQRYFYRRSDPFAFRILVALNIAVAALLVLVSAYLIIG